MDSIEYDSRRKSSCATVVPPQKNRKVSIPLTINCKDTAKGVFYDTGSMTDMSPTTAVSSRRHLPIYPSEPQDTSFISSIKSKFLNMFNKNNNATNSRTSSTTQRAEDEEEEKAVHLKEPVTSGKTVTIVENNNSSQSTLGKKPRPSYSDLHLSPGSTAVGYEDDVERQGYFGTIPAKKKRTPRGWVAAVLMVVVGALIAVTFVLVGLGKALGGNNNNSSSPSNTTTTATTTATVSSMSDISSATPSLFVTTITPTAAQLKSASLSPIPITFTVVPSSPTPTT